LRCPNCSGEGTLDWIQTFCEFECSNCGEKFTIHDLADAGEI